MEDNLKTVQRELDELLLELQGKPESAEHWVSEKLRKIAENVTPPPCLQCELKDDPDRPDIYFVKAMDDPAEVATFSGPDSLGRAIAFAGGGKYYSGWADPGALAGH